MARWLSCSLRLMGSWAKLVPYKTRIFPQYSFCFARNHKICTDFHLCFALCLPSAHAPSAFCPRSEVSFAANPFTVSRTYDEGRYPFFGEGGVLLR